MSATDEEEVLSELDEPEEVEEEIEEVKTIIFAWCCFLNGHNQHLRRRLSALTMN